MRLIDADALIADLDKGLWGKDWDKALAEAIIEDAPSVDAVEVVRCKDCKYSEVLGKSLIRYCDHSIIPMIRDDDGYCSCGERRTE